MGVKRGALVLHLTEHRGDADGPGAAYLQVENVRLLHLELQQRGSSDEPIDQAWGSTELKLVDPFGNKLTFTSPTLK